ncbi:MAG: IclR family transcriptional regulator [Jatrophihabitantaceae bacterium]
MSRAAAALVALGSLEAIEQDGLGVVRIAELVGGDKGQVSRVLTTLAGSGLVERDERSLNYRLGWQLYALAARAGDRRLLEAARPMVRRLVDELGERANLSVLREAQVLTVFSESPPRSVQAAGWVGRTVPAYCTASGRALLFDATGDELRQIFAGVEFERPGPKAPRTVEELARRLGASRRRGFAVVDEEFEPGLVAVAAPVRDFHGRVCAAINISAPRYRLGGRPRRDAVGGALKAAADELSGLLGTSQHEQR